MAGMKLFAYVVLLVAMLAITCFARPMAEDEEPTFRLRELVNYLVFKARLTVSFITISFFLR
jgi:hypothetical protein